MPSLGLSYWAEKKEKLLNEWITGWLLLGSELVMLSGWLTWPTPEVNGGGDGVSSEWRAGAVVTESPSSDSEPESSAEAFGPSPSLAELPPETLNKQNNQISFNFFLSNGFSFVFKLTTRCQVLVFFFPISCQVTSSSAAQWTSLCFICHWIWTSFLKLKFLIKFTTKFNLSKNYADRN